MGCFFVELNRLGDTPAPTLERVGATPTAEVEYLGGVPIASLVGLSDVPTAVLEHLGGMTVSGSLLCYVGNDTLSISETSLSFTNEEIGAVKTFSIMATSDWIAELIDPMGMFSISKTSGIGGLLGKVAITLVSENTDSSQYNASVVVKCGGLRKVLSLAVEAGAVETYTRLTYIECNGQQYIDLGYVVKEDDVIEADFILTKIANADTFLFGTVDANAGLWFEFYSKTAYVRFGASESKSISSSAGKYTVKLEKGKVTLGTTATTLEYEQLPNNTINLFAGKGRSYAAYSYGHYRCTKFRISDSNGLVMDLVPVKRDSDGVIGMLDTVSGTFYVSAEEPFIGGGEIHITNDYEIINHIAFNADKIFDAGIIESTYTIESLWARDTTSSSQFMYGFVTSPHTASVTAYLGGTWRWGNQGSSLTFKDKNQHYTRQYNANIYYDGSTRAYSKSPAFTTANTLVVGGIRDSTGDSLATFTGKIYYYRIYDGSSVMLEWQPCKRLSDGVEGFWDCVTQTFIEPI